MIDKPVVVWKPLAGSQTLASCCPCNTIMLEGTRGPGKTEAQIMFFRRFVGLGYGSFWRGIIFDREYKNLDDIVAKTKRWFPKFNDGARFLSSGKDLKWVWPTGEELLIRAAKKLTDYWNYHGQEFPYIGWNELTKYPTPDLYDMMLSCNRSSYIPEENKVLIDGDLYKRTGQVKLLHTPQIGEMDYQLPELPLVVFSTTNPFGPGHTWVKKRFIDVGHPGQIIKTITNVFNPRTQKREDVIRTQVRIFGSYRENRYLSPEYVATLESMTDPNKRKAWLKGDWDIVGGGALGDLWGPHLVLPRFVIPKTWRVNRSLDWGSSHPFSVGWWAEANGEAVMLPDGTYICPRPGSLIRIFELYGSTNIGSNKGVLWSSVKLARKILEIEEMLLTQGWIANRPWAGPADGSIYDVHDHDESGPSETIGSKMEGIGVSWLRADKSAGSRKIGLQLIRDRMEASKTGDGPGIYFMDNCAATKEILPYVPRDEEDLDDVDTESEDHLYDEVRYRVLSSNNNFATDLNVKMGR